MKHSFIECSREACPECAAVMEETLQVSERSRGDARVFICGPRGDHVCDSEGPTLCGGQNPDGSYWQGSDQVPENRKRANWGSVSCSKCGMTAMEKSLWEDSEWV